MTDSKMLWPTLPSLGSPLMNSGLVEVLDSKGSLRSNYQYQGHWYPQNVDERREVEKREPKPLN